MTTNKYLIQHGKHTRWEDVDGQQTLVTRKPGDIIEMTLQQAQERQHSVRLATLEDIAAYEARLRGELDPPATIPDTHVSTAGAPPAPTPAVDPLQPPATADQPPARHFVPPASPVPVPAAPPVVPEAQHVVVPAAAPAPPAAAPAAPAAPVSQTQRASDSASAKAENEGKPKARTGNKSSAKKTSGTRSRSRR